MSGDQTEVANFAKFNQLVITRFESMGFDIDPSVAKRIAKLPRILFHKIVVNPAKYAQEFSVESTRKKALARKS